MRLNYRLFIAVLTVVMAGSASAHPSRLTSKGNTPEQIVRSLWTQIISNNTAQDPESAGKFIKDQLKSSYDFYAFYQVALQDHWSAWSEDQKTEFSQRFETIFLQSLVKKLSKVPRKGAELITQKVNTSGDRAQAFFRGIKNDKSCDFRIFLVRHENNWRIYDVEVEGVLLSRNYRGQFNRILRKEHYEGLLARLDRKLASQGDHL